MKLMLSLMELKRKCSAWTIHASGKILSWCFIFKPDILSNICYTFFLIFAFIFAALFTFFSFHSMPHSTFHLLYSHSSLSFCFILNYAIHLFRSSHLQIPCFTTPPISALFSMPAKVIFWVDVLLFSSMQSILHFLFFQYLTKHLAQCTTLSSS